MASKKCEWLETAGEPGCFFFFSMFPRPEKVCKVEFRPEFKCLKVPAPP